MDNPQRRPSQMTASERADALLRNPDAYIAAVRAELQDMADRAARPLRMNVIGEPWWYRARMFIIRHTVCRIRGHDTIVKFSGTRLCRRCR